ncbi:MAG: hypothetical protein ABIJ31_13760 [Pseudomonadota bacterium]
MIKIQDIKGVELGPRQLMLEFGDHTEDHQDFIVDSLETMMEAQGQVFISDFVDHTAQTQGWPCSDILQWLFWAAHEMKIHFRRKGCVLTSFEAKRHLLQSPENSVELITNKKVKPALFREAALIYQSISNDNDQEYKNDQYQLALSLLSVFQHWESQLISFAGKAQNPFFPGKELISTHLQSLKRLSAKKDSYSLLSNCYTHKDTIFKIVQDVKRLSVFYLEHGLYWEHFIQSMEDFRENLAEIKNFPETLHVYEQLNQILVCAFPCDRIGEVKLLLPKVRKLNDRIVQEKLENCRREALYRIDTVIDHLSGLLAQLDTKLDKRNRILYPLHMQKKQLAAMDSLQQIENLVTQALDRADDFIIELEEDARLI